MKTRIALILLALALTACTSATPIASFTPSIETPTVLSTFTPTAVYQTLESLPAPTPTASLPTQALLPASLPKLPLEGYSTIFLKEEYLYFQDGNNSPIQLAHIGKYTDFTQKEKGKYLPGLSSDGQKIFFYRYEGSQYHIYSINTDGTKEQAVLQNSWLDSLKKGTKEYILGFVPFSHKLLLLSYLCTPQDKSSPCLVMLFITDADTGKITHLADYDMPYYYPLYSKNIQISPNGEMIAVGDTNGIDIFTLDGDLIRENILPYKPATKTRNPMLFWLPDSSELIVALPDRIFNSPAYNNIVAYSVSHYSIQDNTAVQVPLDVPPMASEIEFSPDGKWGIYGGFAAAEPSLYLADLTTGHVQVFAEDGQPSFLWSPDSKHFNYGTALQNISTVENPSTIIKVLHFGSFIGWVDKNHFIYSGTDSQTNREKVYMAESDTDILKIYDLDMDRDVIPWLLIKPK